MNRQKELFESEKKEKENQYFIILYRKSDGSTFVKPVWVDKNRQSSERFKRKLMHNYLSFDYMVTLTFAAKPHYANINRWFFDKNYNLTRYLDKNGGRPCYRLHNVDFEKVKHLKWDVNLKNFLRRFLNRFQTTIQRDFKEWVFRFNRFAPIPQKVSVGSKMSYAWKYEEGSKKHRPHFHILFSMSDIDPPGL